MSTFWSIWVIVITVVCLALVLWVLLANRKVAIADDQDPENRTTGHNYDGIEEYDNPLPRWWFQLFILTMVFSAIYLVLYPGLGNFKGILNWTSTGELQHDIEQGQKAYEKSYAIFNKMSVDDLVDDADAMKMGARLFSNNCAVCHGADAGGNFGFPDLTDKDWLYGGTPDTIQATITNGRQGAMPAWGSLLGEEKVGQVVEYVLSLSAQDHSAALAEQGKVVFEQNCAVCHGADGKGNQAMGAPNLTDSIWLYNGTREGITQTVRGGRNNQMPAQKDLLREEKIHLLTAYVYSLSQPVD